MSATHHREMRIGMSLYWVALVLSADGQRWIASWVQRGEAHSVTGNTFAGAMVEARLAARRLEAPPVPPTEPTLPELPDAGDEA